MFECSEIGCTNRVAHPGQPCMRCDFEIAMRESDHEDDDELDAEFTCFKCGTREAILNGLCGMCGELNPRYM